MPGASEVAFASAHVFCKIDGQVEFFAYASQYEMTRAVGINTTFRARGLVAGPLEGKLQLQFGLTGEMMHTVRELAKLAEDGGPNEVELTFYGGDGSPIGQLGFQGHITGIRLTTGIGDGDMVAMEMVVLSDPETGNLHQTFES